MISNLFFTAKAVDVFIRGEEMRMTVCPAILTAMGVSEFFWDGTTGYKEDMSGTRTVLANVDEFADLIWLADHWMDTMVVSWVFGKHKPIRIQNNDEKFSIIAWEPEQKEAVRENAHVTNVEVDEEGPALCRIYLPGENQSYKFDTNGVMSEVSWPEGEALFNQRADIRSDASFNKVN